jgi:hypothetical protein
MDTEVLKATPAPSARRIAVAALVAILVAALLLVMVVLPAEYGIDPLGTGAALGLLALSQAEESAAAVAVRSADYVSQPQTYKTDSRVIRLEPGEGIEIKYHMARGAGMVYAWRSTSKVFFEFHGEPDEKPHPNYYDSYELDDQEGKEESFGTFNAPSTGIHGWFWENGGTEDVMIHLTTAGFYDSAVQFTDAGPVKIPLQEVK